MFFVTLTSSKFPFVHCPRCTGSEFWHIIIRVSTYIKGRKILTKAPFQCCLHFVHTFVHIFKQIVKIPVMYQALCSMLRKQRWRHNSYFKEHTANEGRKVSKWIVAGQCDKKKQESDCLGNYQSKRHCSFLLNKKNLLWLEK